MQFLLACAVLAPAFVFAVPGPQPTVKMEIDPAVMGWSPAPTQGPMMGAMEMFRKRDGGDNTCGYISGSSGM